VSKISIDGITAYVEDSENYLQINDICDADLERIWQHLRSDYADYDKWFCYHNMECPSILTCEFGAVIKDDNIETKLTSLDYYKYDANCVVRVTDENFAEFAVHHDELQPEMYWTSERLKRDLLRWGIFILRAGNKTVGYIILSMGDAIQAEIFCVKTLSKIQYEMLIAYASKFAFDNGKDEVLFMVDKNSIAHKAALSVGFNVTGFYKGYKISRGL